MSNVLLSIGHGYGGQATARHLPAGWSLLATTRDPARLAALRDGGAEPVLWPDQAAPALARATHVISWVPPDAQGDPVAPRVAALPTPALRWIGYASASSVYGDSAGAWIDERAAAAPTTDRGAARLAAETAWADLAAARRLPFCALRIAGIYGPGRSVLDALRQGRGQRIIKPGQVFNRIHVEDLGRIAAAAAARRLVGPLIVADDEPAPPQEVMAYGAALLRLPCPPDTPFEDAVLSPMARSFYAENKRLRSIRLGPDLGLRLTFPDYRTGLARLVHT